MFASLLLGGCALAPTDSADQPLAEDALNGNLIEAEGALFNADGSIIGADGSVAVTEAAPITSQSRRLVFPKS